MASMAPPWLVFRNLTKMWPSVLKLVLMIIPCFNNEQLLFTDSLLKILLTTISILFIMLYPAPGPIGEKGYKT